MMTGVRIDSMGDDRIRSSLPDLIEELCCQPREDAYCELTLALASAVPDVEVACQLTQEALDLAALPVKERWDLGQHLVETLNALATGSHQQC